MDSRLVEDAVKNHQLGIRLKDRAFTCLGAVAYSSASAGFKFTRRLAVQEYLLCGQLISIVREDLRFLPLPVGFFKSPEFPIRVIDVLIHQRIPGDPQKSANRDTMRHSPGSHFASPEENHLTLTPVKSYVPKPPLRARATNREMSILGFISSTNGMCPFLQRVDMREEAVNVASYPTSIAHPKVAERFCLAEETSPDRLESKISALRILAAELSIAILFLHQHGIVHQNIKPANVMISRDGHAILGDFGASRMLHAPGRLPRCMSSDRLHVSSECDSDGLGFGSINLQPNDNLTLTPFYAAPELLDRKPDAPLEYDERVDWWSLGLTLYEMVVGINSFSYFTNLAQQPEAHIIHEIVPELCDLLESLLAREVNERLCGIDILKHPFFDPLTNTWDEIKALKHPPCLCPPRISFFAPKISREAHIDDKLRRQSILGESSKCGNATILQSNHSNSSNASNSQTVIPHSDARHIRSRSYTYPDLDIEDDGMRGSITILQPGRTFTRAFPVERNGVSFGPGGPNHRRAYSGGYENEYASKDPTSSPPDGQEWEDSRNGFHPLPATTLLDSPSRRITDKEYDSEQSFNDSGLEFPVGELAAGWAYTYRKQDNIAPPLSKIHSQEIVPSTKPPQNLPTHLNDSVVDSSLTFEENLTISMLRAGIPNQPGSTGCKARRRVSSARRIASASARFVNAIRRRLIPVSTVRNVHW